MPENALFRELCKPETLRIGWHLAQLDSRDDFVADPVSYEDFASNLSDRLGYIVREIRHQRYRPRYLTEIDVPKSGLGIRPGNVLPIDEAALLHAVVYVLAPKIDRRLSDHVYSYRLAKDWQKRVKRGRSMFREGDDEIPFLRGVTIRRIDPFEPWYSAWPEFDRQRIAAVKKRGYTHLTRTDIAAYFENIDLGLLDHFLRQIVPNEPVLVSLLMRVLNSWTRVTSTGVPVGRGIPQGNEICSFLGNIYLRPLDRELTKFASRTGAEWLRYVDDVEVYTKNPDDARAVVLVINDTLRRLYLNLQGSKTEILTGRDLDRALARSESEVLDAAWEAIEALNQKDKAVGKKVTRILSNIRPIARRFRRGLPGSVRALSASDSRILRRAMTLWGYAGRPYLMKVAVATLTEPPEYRLLLKSLRYLEQQHPKSHDRIIDVLLGLLGGSVPLLPFHAAAILGTLRWLHPTEAKLNLARQITAYGFRRKAEWPVRQKALELLAVMPARPSTALRRAQNSLKHPHPFVRRAALLMLTRSSVQDVRTQVNRLIHDPDLAVSRLAGHWHRLINDRSAGETELARLKQAPRRDRTFVWHIPKLWVLRCSPELDIIIGLRSYLEFCEQSRSAKVRYHVRALRKQTDWVVAATATAGLPGDAAALGAPGVVATET